MTNTEAEAVAAGPQAAPAVPWPAVSVVMVGMFMAILDSFIVVVAGPAIQADLGASVGQLQWILAGYQLSYAVVMITGGRLADLYGRKRVFITGTAVFTLASLAWGPAPDPRAPHGGPRGPGGGAAPVVGP
ncbi:MFS transporter, partial [Streptomyces goshikiensis]